MYKKSEVVFFRENNRKREYPTGGAVIELENFKCLKYEICSYHGQIKKAKNKIICLMH